MDKNGFLLAEETLKIILAVISIGFLVYFLSALYFANQNSEELEQAEASLEFLINEINSGSYKVEIYNPEGWVISSWPFENEIPEACNGKSCICICEEEIETVKISGLKEDCDNTGICLEGKFAIESDRTLLGKDILKNSIKIENPPITLSIKDNIITK